MKKPILASFIILAATVAALTANASGDASWMRYCKSCHGADGAGQTAMGKRLKIKDLNDVAVQAELTDEAITEAISEGKKNEAGRKVMLSFKKKLSPEQIEALLLHVRSFKEE